MSITLLELLLRAGTVVLAAAAAIALLLRGRRNDLCVYAALAIGGIAAFAIASARGALAHLGFATLLFNIWCLANPAVILLLAVRLFRERARPGAMHWALVGVFTALAMAGDYGRFALGPAGGDPQAASILFIGSRIAALGMLAFAMAIAASGWRADLIEERRRVRVAYVGVIGAVFLAFSVSSLLFGTQGAPQEVLLVGHALLMGFTFLLLQLIAMGRLDPLLDETPAVPSFALARPRLAAVANAPTATGGLEAALARRIVEEMESRRLWKREGLGIAELAQELRTQEYLVRRAINRCLGYRNFNDFMHDYRLREAARRLADPQERLPVLSIALDCGYGSIGPFNRAFKARFGVTPTQYRHLREDERPLAYSEINEKSR